MCQTNEASGHDIVRKAQLTSELDVQNREVSQKLNLGEVALDDPSGCPGRKRDTDLGTRNVAVAMRRNNRWMSTKSMMLVCLCWKKATFCILRFVHQR